MAKTKDALKAEVPGVYRTYCLQVWNEALNLAGVEASSVHRKAESVYYPPTICPSPSSSSEVDTPPKVVDPEKSGSEKAFSSSGNLPKVAEQPRVNEKETEVTKGVPPNAIKPPAVPQDPTKDNEASRMEILLATLPFPTKGDPKCIDQGSSEATVQQSKASPYGKIVIKKN